MKPAADRVENFGGNRVVYIQWQKHVSFCAEVGLCWVNCWFVRDLRTAFGGSKMSGIGREGGAHPLEFYTELTNVCVQL